MSASGLRTVLCAGNGISPEPRALAAAGFDVTALDFSPAATRLASIRPEQSDVFCDPNLFVRADVWSLLRETCWI
jgi:hypothetical protein